MFAVWAALMAARPGMRDRPWATMAASATGRRRQTTNGAKTATPMIAAPEIICPHACDELRQRCRPMLDACATPLDHQYKGMFDGPTNIDLDWDTSAGVVLNLSAVLDQAVPLELAMISGAGWGQALMHGHRDRLKLNVIDESYKALQDSAMVSYFLDGWRVAANSAAATWSSSTPSPNSEPNSDGAAAVKQTEALLNTTSVKVYLHQNHDQAADLLSRFGLTTAEAGRLRPCQPTKRCGRSATTPPLLSTPPSAPRSTCATPTRSCAVNTTSSRRDGSEVQG